MATNGAANTNGTTKAIPTIRLATIEDVPSILAMIIELASFEKAADSVHATESSLRETLTFAPSAENPEPKQGYAKTFMLTLPSSHGDGAEEDVCGMALYFTSYSTWLSCPGIYLEDLYIRPEYRRRGYATLLLRRLAEEAGRISGGKGRLEWSCLRWNSGALEFYERIGGKRLDEWVGIRVEGEGLATMGAGEGMDRDA